MERPLVFPCQGERLVGILHRPESPEPLAVVVVAGAPQYRVGSHRQFVTLARHLAAAGFAVLRFDYRGMGDSEGPPLSYLDVSADLRAAVDVTMEVVPEVRGVVLWGLCDGATAAALYAPEDERVAGLVLMNPWVREAARHAKIVLRHYYVRRLFSPALWRKVLSGRFRAGQSLDSLRATLKSARDGGGRPAEVRERKEAGGVAGRLLGSLARFGGSVLLVLSGRDLVAREFEAAVDEDPRWAGLKREGTVVHRALPDADHTCSSHQEWDAVLGLTLGWMRECRPGEGRQGEKRASTSGASPR